MTDVITADLTRQHLAENFIHSNILFDVLVESIISNPKNNLSPNSHIEVGSALMASIYNHVGKPIFKDSNGKSISTADGDYAGLDGFVGHLKATKAYLFNDFEEKVPFKPSAAQMAMISKAANPTEKIKLIRQFEAAALASK